MEGRKGKQKKKGQIGKKGCKERWKKGTKKERKEGKKERKEGKRKRENLAMLDASCYSYRFSEVFVAAKS